MLVDRKIYALKKQARGHMLKRRRQPFEGWSRRGRWGRSCTPCRAGGGGSEGDGWGFGEGLQRLEPQQGGTLKIVQGCEQQSRTHLLSSMLTVVSASAATSSSASESASLHDGSLLPAACTDACFAAASMAAITFGLYWGLQHGHGEHAQETWQHRMREDGGV